MSDNLPPTKKLKKATTEDGASKTTNDFLSDVAAQRNKVSNKLQIKMFLNAYINILCAFRLLHQLWILNLTTNVSVCYLKLKKSLNGLMELSIGLFVMNVYMVR